MLLGVTIKDVKDKIGQLCKQQRKARGLSQSELAEALEMSRITVQNVENGKNATLDTLLKIANHFSMLEDIYQAMESGESKSDVNSLY